MIREGGGEGEAREKKCLLLPHHFTSCRTNQLIWHNSVRLEPEDINCIEIFSFPLLYFFGGRGAERLYSRSACLTHALDTLSEQDGSRTSLCPGLLSPPARLRARASPVVQSVLGDPQGEHHLPAVFTGCHRRHRGPDHRVADHRECGGGGSGGGGRRNPGRPRSRGVVSSADSGSSVSLRATSGRCRKIGGAAQTFETVEEW